MNPTTYTFFFGYYFQYLRSFANISAVLIFAGIPIMLSSQNQTRVRVNNIVQVEDHLEVYYNLLHVSAEETFKIRVEIYQPNGQSIPVKRVVGDYGNLMRGTTEKKIKIILDEGLTGFSSDLYVKLIAVRNLDLRNPYFTPERNEKLIKAAIWPSWGANDGKVRKKYLFLAGALTYAAFGGSIYYNRKAQDHYEAYIDSEFVVERRNLYQEAEDYKKISKGLAYGGAAVWLGNMVFSMLEKIPENGETRFSFGPAKAYPGLRLSINLSK